MTDLNAVIPPAAAPVPVVPPTPTIEDAQAQIAALEAEKAKLIEQNANVTLGMMKAKAKLKEEPSDENDEEKMRRIAHETLANSRLTEIAQEQDAIIQRALKENRELKLAQLNKTGAPPAAVGTHSEGTPVTDTLVTPEQMSAFKARGWSDKDIERYKKNLNRYAR